MVDLDFIRKNPEILKEVAKAKKIEVDIDRLVLKDQRKRELTVQVDELRAQRNKAAKNRDVEGGREIKTKLDELEKELQAVEDELLEILVKVPTVFSSDTPIGEGEEGNVEVYKWGEALEFDFEVKDHIQLGIDLDVLDLERGAKVGGYKGYYLKNEGVKLALALMWYALDRCISEGFSPMIPPTLVKEKALFGSGYFKGLHFDPSVDEIYQVNTEEDNQKKFLIGTAEPSLLAYFSDEVLNEADLPIKICGFSPCYRNEIGSYGKENRGIYRVHEFFKIEQIVLSPADSDLSCKIQDEMINVSKKLLEDLGLPYRQVQICTGDLSAGKYRQFDLEVWMSGLKKYGESGSGSNFLDWQARRLNVRYLNKGDKKTFVYMLNNTALPSPRIIIAILENYQLKDGSVKIPDVLVPYTGFDKINPKR